MVFPPNDLSHLSDEEFNALAPQGYHTTGPAEPLSPAAQAVKDAVLALYSDEKVHKFGWQLDAPTVAAALRAAVEQSTYQDAWDCQFTSAEKILAIADELDNNATH
jgi:hypothetical protein